MNILLMARIIEKTGVGNHIKQLSEELSRQGHNVWVVASTNKMEIGGQMYGGTFTRIELRSKNPFSILKSLRELHTLIENNNIDIVHCHHRMAALFMAFYNLFWEMPYLWTLHLAPIPCGPIHRLMTNYGKKAIAISKEVGDFLQSGLNIPERDIAYVLNGVDESLLVPASQEERVQVRKQMEIADDQIVVALHSRIDSVKNHEAVVEAVGLLTPQERKKLVIVCSGQTVGNYYMMIRNRIDELGIGNCFRFCGWVTARTILSAADILMLPSLKEGFALNCIEAMFMGVPVVRTKTGGYENMKDYCIGMEDPSAQTVCYHLRRLLSGKDLDYDRTERAKSFVQRKCTVKAMAASTVAVYQSVLEK